MFHKFVLPVSVVCFIIAGVLFSSQVLAVGKPEDKTFGYDKKINSMSAGKNRMDLSSDSEEANDSSQSGNTKKEFGKSHMPPFAQIRLQNAKLRACEAKASSIVKRSNHLVELAEKMIRVFTSISGGVEQYYLTKVVPTGAILPNYDDLVADIATKQNAIAPLLQAAKDDASNFSCTGNNPKAQLTQYRTDMQAVIRALKEYRTSVRNLIVAVRTLPSIKGTITPSATPSVTLIPTITIEPSVTPLVTP